MDERKLNCLVKALEKYNSHTVKITDAIYEFIDEERDKVSLCEMMSRHRKLLKRLESLLSSI